MRNILCIAYQGYRYFIMKSTSLIMLFSLVYFWERLVFPIVKICKTYGFSIHPSEIYLHILSDGTQVFIIPLMFIALISDFPSERSSGLFFLIRTGRIRWMKGQLLFALLAGLTYLFILFIGTSIFVMPYAQWDSWGSFNTSLAASFPQIYRNQSELFLDATVISQGDPQGVTLQATALILGHLFVISLILMYFKLLGKRLLGLLITISLSLCGFVSVEILPQIEWIFPMAHGMFSTHFDGVLAQPICPIWLSALYFLFLLFVFFYGSIVTEMKKNFQRRIWNRDFFFTIHFNGICL